MGKITTSSIYSVLSEKLRICINLKLSRLESRYNLDLGKNSQAMEVRVNLLFPDTKCKCL